jgi:flagellar export protein FliJ
MKVTGTGLATVLKVKEFQEKTTQRELAAIKVNRETEEGKLGELEQSRSSAMAEAGCVVRSSAGDMQTARAFIHSLGRQVEQQGERVEAAKAQEDVKRGELVERSQSRQMVEKLDSRRREEVEKENEKKSQRVMDVLAQRMNMGLRG